MCFRAPFRSRTRLDLTPKRPSVRAVLIVLLLAAGARTGMGDRVIKLSPRDGEEGDQFGVSVDVDQSMAVVGADHKDASGNNSGVAYLVDITTGATRYKLTAPDAAADDQFGFEVAIDGGTTVVGAPLQDEVALDAGAAYVFDTDSGGPRRKLTAADGADSDQLGWSVALDSGKAVAGAPFADSKGAAYVFDVTSGEQLVKLSIDDGAEGDTFGVSADISGTAAIVGASGDDQVAQDAGAAYLFDVSTGQQLWKLTIADGNPLDFFGFSVAIEGDRAVVGALGAVNEVGVRTGAAYLFDVGTGNVLGKLTADDGEFEDFFGLSVAIQGDRVVVGAPGDDDLGEESGAAYVFDLVSGRQLDKLIAADGEYDDETGTSVAVSGERAVVGSPFGVRDEVVSGVAHVFDLASPPPELQAGDADQDLDFDQLDLVRVQVAAKYLTGQPATWGEGDWDAAPGGLPGAPPQGNGVFDQLDIVAAQVAGLYLTGRYAAVGRDGLAVPVPEPSTLMLLCIGMIAFGFGARGSSRGRVRRARLQLLGP